MPLSDTPADDPVYIRRIDRSAKEPASPDIEVIPLHSTNAAHLAVQVLQPGASLPQHHHTHVWDYFVGLRGTASVTLWSADESPESYSLTMGDFLGIPPGQRHEVTNESTTESFAYLLMQAPYAEFDFVTDGSEGDA